MSLKWYLGVAMLGGLHACAVAEIDYRVNVQPEQNKVDVQMSFHTRGSDPVILQMPNWMPGFYVLSPSGNNLHDFSATDGRGGALAVSHSDSNTWSVSAPSDGLVKVTYSIPARGGFNNRGPSANVDNSYLELSGPTTYLYVSGRKEEKCKVSFAVPDKWQVVLGLDAAGGPANTYTAPTYDVLADNPVALGDLIVDSYTLRGKPHFIVLEGPAKAEIDRAKLSHICRFVTAAETDFWGDAPYHKYAWLFTIRSAGRGGGGLEHLSSTQIGMGTGLGGGMPNLLAHEYFHLWNVKRVRSKDLGPFDYTKLPSTSALWWLEGVTDYYADLLPYRYSEQPREQFFGSIISNYKSVEGNPAHLTVSPMESSRRVGEAAGGKGNSNGYQISYYNLGWLCGLCLDLEIRSQSHGKHSLDDVAHALYAICKNGRPGFGEDEIRKQCIRFGGPSLGAFYDRVVNAPGELPVGEELAKAGFHLAATGIIPDPNATSEAKALADGWLFRKQPDYEK